MNNTNVKLPAMAGQGGAAFGIALMELINVHDDIMVLSADMSTPAGLDKFKANFPEHFMNVGIAEQNMIGIAAGLASEGFKVICVAQACFISMRCYEQLRQFAGYMKFPIIIVGIGSGLSLQFMGNTHYAVEDLALMRTLPDVNVLAPCDALEAMKSLEYALAQNTSSYIRMFGGTNTPIVHNQDFGFNDGKPIKLRDGKDVAVLATGSMVKQALDAAGMLASDNVDCEVLSVPKISPLDFECLFLHKPDKLVVTVEEHRKNGGLGSRVADFLIENDYNSPFLRLGIDNDFFPHPGSYGYLLEQCGLTAEQIAGKIKEALNQSGASK